MQLAWKRTPAVTRFDDSCIFCRIIRGEIPADKVYEDGDIIAFLDARPLFPGHVLVSPKEHIVTLSDLPASQVGRLFEQVQIIARAVETALDAEGTFVAINNRVSQTVPHLHVHVVPRRNGDGLKGFFWPRRNYQDGQAREVVRGSIESAIQRLMEGAG